MEIPNTVELLIEVGDRVRIARDIPDWDCERFTWIPSMSTRVGTVETVTKLVTNRDGTRLAELNHFCHFPLECLEWVSAHD